MVSIQDDGKGISENIREQIFERGFTSGKENGTGYGLYHARKFIESWGGSFELSRDDNATFIMSLPIWKMPELRLEDATTVVVLDDEVKVHNMWRAKLARVNPSAQLLAFETQQELNDWFDTCEDFSGHLFFFDSDLGENSDDTGESLIESLGISSMAHLVTNNYNSPILAKWCHERGISLLPKALI